MNNYMNMMKSFLILGFFIFSSTAFSQSNDSDKDLLLKYSQEEIDNIKVQDFEEYEYLKYCAKNAFYLNPIPMEKMSEGQTRIGSITIKDASNINFFELNLEIIQDDYQYFAIEGTDQMLVVKSKDHILKELRK
ncbi:hypothetical protein FRY74_11005 [Vicingus serpentipes]|uniref:Uncharacterized protein n=1 Tax=Vicingus serpentipes TaxID=1926625 RepID=A0A5C6RQ21_9FLAO|nr:hypothetical protein [Vicingus serpentipes]TXB64313.1 hypothetical protein FRY74_11005 [Vicingus serpentipes]